ncbi:hypothetical protein H312_03469 [Anncaliia algerae PRA339]|uniref:Uncharacterized protein n=1 Tax=Anncaliia algerae PRA339 TaxID=1288291 RepID=A0A059EWR4_9MICR|nr:hypothetical protein H312_03469 [Anncaliia algerae PRA339]
MNIFEIGILTKTHEEAFRFAKHLELINTCRKTCPRCVFLMNLEKRKMTHGINFRWACRKNYCKHKCVYLQTEYSIHLQICDVLRIIYYLSTWLSLTDTINLT